VYSLIDEQKDFLVLCKQSGVSIHNESNEGLIQRLREDFKTANIFPVHRLDKPTSGLLLCAKNTNANRELSTLFQSRNIEKYYLAISDKKPKKKQGLISGDMQRTRDGNWKLCQTRHNPALTQFFSYGINGQRLFILKPLTGKTHQLRVALKSIGAPIAGDIRYGSAMSTAERLYLHAYCLRFYYEGCFNTYVNFPDDSVFSSSLSGLSEPNLQQPWCLPWPTATQKNSPINVDG
jgi:tRNA pseudouridine32 synthase/23S rRNA pseudouridine746 synthase